MRPIDRLVTTLIGAGLLIAPSVAFASFDQNLRAASRGANVIVLQQFLIGQSLLNSDLATVYFGQLTRAAVMNFQRRDNIFPVSGFFGPSTRARANAISLTQGVQDDTSHTA